jgi:hypothetical protein
VAGHPECLYFVLWLKEYTVRYNAWSTEPKSRFKSCLKSSSSDYRTSTSSPQTSRSLASFYARAQQTFFVPGSDYELDVPPDVLGPLAKFDSDRGLWTSAYGAYPDPEYLNELDMIARQRLKVALDHCVVATYTKSVS